MASDLENSLPLMIAGFLIWKMIPEPAAVALPEAGTMGRNLTFEEAEAQALLRRRQMINGENQLMCGGEQRVIKKPWLDLPAGGEAYIKLNNANQILPAIGTTLVVVEFRVPPRKNGTIEFIANQIIGGPGIDGTGTVRWQVLADGSPIKNYESIIASIGTMTNPADLRDSPIRIFANQLIQLVLVNVSQAANEQIVMGMLRGKLYPLEQEGPNTWV